MTNSQLEHLTQWVRNSTNAECRRERLRLASNVLRGEAGWTEEKIREWKNKTSEELKRILK